MKKESKFILLNMVFCLLSISIVQAQEEDDIFEMSLEDLMNMEISSVSKKSERLQDVSSSIYVVTSSDIMKSGATTLHEVLRNVPGYWGVQDYYSSVSSGMRNSPARNAETGTVLYLLDGTSVQNTMGSSFSFENFDIPLDEIDRIEVIIGSGGTVYGANSATGVISIFTKDPGKYDGVNVRAEAAAPGYANVSLRAGGEITDKLAISGYGKYRYFSGWESLAGKHENGNSILNSNQEPLVTDFTEDYEQSSYYSLGAKLNYQINENAKISARLHHNGYSKITYTNYYDEFYVLTNDDVTPIANDVNASRTVANIKFDQKFSDKHSLFVRVSTNIENDFYRVGGGMEISNAIYDIEIQDNLTIGEYNDLTIGANYRFVNFDIHNINSEININYVDPQAKESIKGAFIQDKLKIWEDKLQFTFGIKAENYSLVNDEYYFSPTAKVSYIANKSITFWGGFSQSYVTPGFNNTNIDYFVFQQPSEETWLTLLSPDLTPAITEALTPIITENVYQAVYDQSISFGADDASATAAAEAYVVSDEGLAAIQTTIDAQVPVQVEAQAAAIRPNNQSAKNGSDTKPTRFQTYEIGVKTNIMDKLQVNATLYKTYITDGIGTSFGTPLIGVPSITDPNRITDYYLSGNYTKGESIGAETIIKYSPFKGLVFEGAHTWLKTEWEYQENDDIDITNLDKSSLKEEDSYIPNHVFRFKADYTFQSGLNVVANVITTSKFQTQGFYLYGIEAYSRGAGGATEEGALIIAENDTRTILNLRMEKKVLNDKLSLYVFGNDITNKGEIANTDAIRGVTLSQIGAMYGVGLNYRIK